MASRRFRVKAVANVPIRRVKGTQETQNSNEKESKDSESLPLDPVLAVTPTEKVTETIIEAQKNNEPTDTLNLSLKRAEITLNETKGLGEGLNSLSETENISPLSEIAENKDRTSTRTPDTIKLPRKRMKPSVCLPAVNRKLKDGSVPKTTTENKSVEKVNTNIEHAVSGDELLKSKQETDGNNSVPVKEKSVEHLTSTSSCGSVLQDTAVCSSGIGQNSNSEQNKELVELPVNNELGDLPVNNLQESSETDLAKICPSVNTFRSRFIRPKPRIFDSPSRHCKVRNVASPGESDGEKKTLSEVSTLSPPWQPNLSVSRSQSHRSGVVDINKSVQGSGTSASESEDDRSVLSVATTLSPPKKVKKLCRGDDSAAQDGGIRSPEVGRENVEPVVKKTKTNTVKKRHRTEYYRRIVEIKKEIVQKLENGKVNKSRLTMFELIYYNPATNPMKSTSESSEKENASAVPSENEDRLAEESVDEPSAEVTEEEKDEESSAMPVPQVKVGPNGEIILDEQSLVIETTDVKKNRTNLQNSAVVMDYGNGSTKFNAYSKKKKNKVKDWHREETLRFYRALQTVGTDFLVMQSLFPKFSRKDLKYKFKKEERLNGNLVQKALCNPLVFDLTDLQKEFELERQEEERLSSEKRVSKRSGAAKKPRTRNSYVDLLDSPPRKSESDKTQLRMQKRRKRKASTESSDDGQHENSDIEESKIKKKDNKKDYKKKKTEHNIKNGLKKEYKNAMSGMTLSQDNSLTSSLSVEGSKEPPPPPRSPEVEESCGRDTHSGSESDNQEVEYLTKAPKPTRSGRIPQRRIREDFTTVVKSVEEERVEVQEQFFEDDLSVISDEASLPQDNFVIAEDAVTFDENQVQLGNVYENVKPGTLIVLATESPDNPGHQVYKIFMVSDSNKPLPVAVPNNAVTSSGSQSPAQFNNQQNVAESSWSQGTQISVTDSSACDRYVNIFNEDNVDNSWGQEKESCLGCGCDCVASEEIPRKYCTADENRTSSNADHSSDCDCTANEEIPAEQCSTEENGANTSTVICHIRDGDCVLSKEFSEGDSNLEGNEARTGAGTTHISDDTPSKEISGEIGSTENTESKIDAETNCNGNYGDNTVGEEFTVDPCSPVETKTKTVAEDFSNSDTFGYKVGKDIVAHSLHTETGYDINNSYCSVPDEQCSIEGNIANKNIATCHVNDHNCLLSREVLEGHCNSEKNKASTNAGTIHISDDGGYTLSRENSGEICCTESMETKSGTETNFNGNDCDSTVVEDFAVDQCNPVEMETKPSIESSFNSENSDCTLSEGTAVHNLHKVVVQTCLDTNNSDVCISVEIEELFKDSQTGREPL